MTVALATRARRKMNPPTPPDPVTGYALDVVAGRIVTGILVRKACERHLADLASGAARGLHFDAAAAQHAIDFFPMVLRHYKGEWAGQSIELEAWEQFVVGAAFGWKREDGTRRFREVYLEVAKKNGKTLLAAGIAILLAFFDGEPGAEVYSIATKRDQARFVWNDSKAMIGKSPSLARRIRAFALTLLDESSNSFFRPLGRESGEAEQGINAHGGVIDELHVIDDRDAIDNIETSMSARRQPMLWKITTAGKKRVSVWADERADALAVVQGRATDDSMLVLIYTLDTTLDGAAHDDDPFDEANWPKSNPNLGVSVSIDYLRDQAAKAKRSPARLAGFLQLRMNVPTKVGAKGIDLDVWDEGTDLLTNDAGEQESYDEWVQRRAPKGLLGYGGLDLGSVLDLTADIYVFRVDDDQVAVVCRFFCPEEGIQQRSSHDGVPYAQWANDGWLIATPGETTDYAFVRETIKTDAATWQLDEIGYDKWNATQIATELAQDGATMVAIPQTHAGLSPGWREMDKLLIEGKLLHGGHPILRWMASNVEVETDAQGNQKPSKSKSSERIDGIAGLNMAIARMITHPVEVVTPWVIAR
jgi:phage terminase large subunit-like protein